jgi:sterol 3beta-glucosyltransferase
MRIAVIATGSRGDIQPFIALCATLCARGHDAYLVSVGEYSDLAAQHGVALRPFSVDLRAELARPEAQRMFADGGNPLALLRWMRDTGLRYGRQLAMEGRELTADAELIVATGMSDQFGSVLAEYRCVPVIHAFLQPALWSRDYPSAFHAVVPLPGWLNRLEQQFGVQAIWHVQRPLVQEARRILGMPKAPWFSPAPKALHAGEPFLLAFSRRLVPPAREWPRNVCVSGYLFLDGPDDWIPPPALTQFLDGGPPPVYFGFGSMSLNDSRETTETVLGAIERTGCRAIVGAGWGGLGTSVALPANVLAIDSVPHNWLFPKMAAAVHHGGAGTAGAAARAGIPSVIVPFLMDQFFWGWRLNKLGVAPKPLPHAKISAEKLSHAVTEALTNRKLRERAAELGAAVRAEDGLTVAAEFIEGTTFRR